MRRATRYGIDLGTFALLGLAGLIGCQSMGAKTAHRSEKPVEKKTEVAKATKPSAERQNPRKAAEPKEPSLPDESEVAQPTKRSEPDPQAERMAEELNNLSSDLTIAAKPSGIQFDFDVLTNPRPRLHHSTDGHIYITSGMLGQLKSREELAGILALEMARAIAAIRDSNESEIATPPDVPTTGPDDAAREQALAAKQSKPARRHSDAEIRSTAGEILQRAGIASIDLAALESRTRSAKDKSQPVIRPPVESAHAN